MFTANARLPAAAAGLQPELSSALRQNLPGYDGQVREAEAAWTQPAKSTPEPACSLAAEFRLGC